MNNLKNWRQSAKLLVLAAALLCAFGWPGLVRAEPIMLTPTVTALGNGLFRYEFSVTNTSGFDFSAISINVLASPNAIQNLVAPAGFNAFFDAGLGIVDFIQNTLSFTTGATVSGFRFDSPFAPGTAVFTALRLGDNSTPITIQGTTLAPVPEPATLALLGTGLLGIAAMMKRRRKADGKNGGG